MLRSREKLPLQVLSGCLGGLLTSTRCNGGPIDHDMTTRARRFARQLEGRYRLPVALQDERFTSHEADSQLRDESGVRDWRSRKQKLDAHAAQLILKDFFDVTA